MTLADALPQVIIMWIILLIVLYLILSRLEKKDGTMVSVLNVVNLGDLSLIIKEKEYICVTIIISVTLNMVKIIGNMPEEN